MITLQLLNWMWVSSLQESPLTSYLKIPKVIPYFKTSYWIDQIKHNFAVSKPILIMSNYISIAVQVTGGILRAETVWNGNRKGPFISKDPWCKNRNWLWLALGGKLLERQGEGAKELGLKTGQEPSKQRPCCRTKSSLPAIALLTFNLWTDFFASLTQNSECQELHQC